MASRVKPQGQAVIRALVALLAGVVLLNFVDRGAIGIAAPVMIRDLGLSPVRFGLAASAFFLTYGLVQPLIGMAIDRGRAAFVLAVAVAGWAMATVLTSLAASLGMLVVLRLLLGLGEAALFPCVSKLIAGHVPAARRGIANAGVSVGLALGPAIGTLAGGVLLARYGWRMMFLAFGVATLVWLGPWLVLARQIGDAAPADAAPARVGELLSRPTLWVMGLAHALANYGFFFVSIWLPLYLVKARGLPIETMTVFATATYAAQALASPLWGWLADRLVRQGHAPSAAKRGLAVVAELGSALAIVAVAIAPGPALLLPALLTLGVFLGCLPTMAYALGQIHAGPRDAGGWIGVQNAIGSISGIVGPLATGAIVQASGGFAGAFGLAATVSVAGALVFAFAVP